MENFKKKLTALLLEESRLTWESGSQGCGRPLTEEEAFDKVARLLKEEDGPPVLWGYCPHCGEGVHHPLPKDGKCPHCGEILHL